MLIELSDRTAVLVSCVAWTVIGLVSGFAVNRIPLRRLHEDGWLTRIRPWEGEGAVYQRWLRVRRWKDRLPEQGALLRGGYSKRHLGGRSTERLERYVAETRRAETVHWVNLVAGPIFLLWCPPWLGAVMIAFGATAHLPFIIVQRYNRARLSRLLERRAARSALL